MLRDDIYKHIDKGIVGDPFGELVDMILDAAEEDRCVVRLPFRAEVSNGADIIHGGATATLIDTAATGAAWASNRVVAETRGTTVGFTVNFLSPGRGIDLVATAEVVRRGNSLSIVEVEVRDATGREIAKALVTYKLNLSPST